MPELVSDTSPIQYLFQSGWLSLLPKLYGRVLVPRAVVDELRTGAELGISLPDLGSLPWLEVREVSRLPALRFSPDLGLGEKEVLALGSENPGFLLLLDDALARRHADLFQVPYTGTLGVLLRAKREGHLAALAPELTKLAALGFRLAGGTRDSVLRLAGEEP